MDSILKLVYDNWVPGTKIPLPNGVHPRITQELVQKLLANDQLSVSSAQEEIRNNIEGNPFKFDHSNFLSYYIRRFGKSTVVSTEAVEDDGSIYILPLEIRTSADDVPRDIDLKFKGESLKCSLMDTFSPALVKLLQQGKVKILFNFSHDPVDEMDQLADIEKYFEKYNIDGSNVIFLPGNDCRNEYTTAFPNAKLRISPVKFMVSQQAALDASSFPRPTSLGYVSDLLREKDLDSSHIRPKRFLCFNRSMRPHRYALALLALKHNLLENSTFSFLNSYGFGPKDIVGNLKNYLPNEDDLLGYANKIHALIPYELDTQHLPLQQKSGFSTENTKKEWYETSYVHITSETRFGKGKTPFISEKTWRPIANLQPFIYLGNAHSLRVLHELGFKTFHPFIDESYDEETDFQVRLKKIEGEIVKLNNMPIQELHDWYYSITDILIYNQQHLNTVAHIQPYDATFQDIISYYRKI